MSSATGSEHFLHSLQAIHSKQLFEAACITVIVYNFALTFGKMSCCKLISRSTLTIPQNLNSS
ncbi:hypothetical protein D9758_014757 [Tetrapyrgos nigripes]|uniref:Uncharacterized protein n=1 Tax=Tetrapyrgos nigripes TaxID=182062 RepID=A0A8H5CHP1_9AGAR|nr:hypothetical protein D9758_014757 [Tetrapyrgos nigripes]